MCVLRGATLTLLLTLAALIASTTLLLPALVILPLPFASARNVYRAWARCVAAAWFTFAAMLLEWLGGTRVIVYGDSPPADERTSIVIANHHCRIDWMFLWCVAARQRYAGRLRIALKEGLKRAPFFGWAMQSFLFIFLARNDRAGDLARIEENLRHAAARDDPLALLIFPEGTDLSESNVAKSHGFAEAHALPRCEHVLFPRVAGVQCIA